MILLSLNYKNRDLMMFMNKFKIIIILCNISIVLKVIWSLYKNIQQKIPAQIVSYIVMTYFMNYI